MSPINVGAINGDVSIKGNNSGTKNASAINKKGS